MGCLQSKPVELEFNLCDDTPSKNQLFTANPDIDQVKKPAALLEHALLDDHTEVVEITTVKNDIDPVDRQDLLKISDKISKHAIKKIPRNFEKNPEKIIVDSKVIKRAIKPTRSD